MSWLRPKVDSPDLDPVQQNILKTACQKRKKLFLTPLEMTIFSMLGALMYCSKMLMEWAPNIHLLGMFTMVFALCYRKKGLVPLYVFILLTGLYAGFATWWIPYLYIWAVLWGVTMLLPKKMPTAVKSIVYPIVCGLHGICFGILYAPAQAILFGLDWNGMLAWIAAGFPFDVVHGIGDFAAGFLILPLCKLIGRLDKNAVKI